MLLSAFQNQLFKAVVQKADLVTIDGYGIELLLQKLGYENPPRLCGVDLTGNFLKGLPK